MQRQADGHLHNRHRRRNLTLYIHQRLASRTAGLRVALHRPNALELRVRGRTVRERAIFEPRQELHRRHLLTQMLVRPSFGALDPDGLDRSVRRRLVHHRLVHLHLVRRTPRSPRHPRHRTRGLEANPPRHQRTRQLGTLTHAPNQADALPHTRPRHPQPLPRVLRPARIAQHAPPPHAPEAIGQRRERQVRQKKLTTQSTKLPVYGTRIARKLASEQLGRPALLPRRPRSKTQRPLRTLLLTSSARLSLLANAPPTRETLGHVLRQHRLIPSRQAEQRRHALRQQRLQPSAATLASITEHMNKIANKHVKRKAL